MDHMHFGWAVMRLRDGARVSRGDWPSDCWLFLYQPKKGSEIDHGFLVLRMPDGSLASWSLSHFDVLADDWYDLSDDLVMPE